MTSSGTRTPKVTMFWRPRPSPPERAKAILELEWRTVSQLRKTCFPSTKIGFWDKFFSRPQFKLKCRLEMHSRMEELGTKVSNTSLCSSLPTKISSDDTTMNLVEGGTALRSTPAASMHSSKKGSGSMGCAGASIESSSSSSSWAPVMVLAKDWNPTANLSMPPVRSTLFCRLSKTCVARCCRERPNSSAPSNKPSNTSESKKAPSSACDPSPASWRNHLSCRAWAALNRRVGSGWSRFFTRARARAEVLAPLLPWNKPLNLERCFQSGTFPFLISFMSSFPSPSTNGHCAVSRKTRITPAAQVSHLKSYPEECGRLWSSGDMNAGVPTLSFNFCPGSIFVARPKSPKTTVRRAVRTKFATVS
mmetsp:Transcript_16086/g.40919  ORF Transcript_16086/g.40919 Transcript_16086/m.40919 type:complete len:363 (-) Transcript_16086:737-1825(-)